MIAKLNRPDQMPGIEPSMRGPLVLSGLFHVILFTITAVGIPFVVQDKIEIITTPITIEVVDLDEMTQTTRVSKPSKSHEKPQKEPPPRKPAPPQMTADAPPDLTLPKPDKVEEPPEESLPEALVPPPLPKSKPAFKKPPPKPEATKVAKPKDQQDFQSLLKNLIPEEPIVIDSTNDGSADSSAPGQISNLADKLTVSEVDALRAQLAQCWNVLSGARYAEDLVVEVRAYINPDRTLYRAEILDQGRYNRDSHFRAAADAALRALRNPRCSPLALPPEKYEQWKTTRIKFDPRDML